MLARKNDPESREYWRKVDELAEEVKQLPEWMKGAKREVTEPSRQNREETAKKSK